MELDFLLRFPFKAGVISPVDFLQHQGWGGIKVSPQTPALRPFSLLWSLSGQGRRRLQGQITRSWGLHKIQ